MSNLSDFEQMILSHLANPHAEPKFQLWQETRQGRICGYYFMRVEIAFSEQCEPGWHYHVETGREICILHEDSLEEESAHD